MTKYLKVILASAAVATASPLLAHAHLVTSNPVANAATANPRKLVLTFSERLVPAFSKLELVMPMGSQKMAIPLKTTVGADGRTLVGVPQAATLMKGPYVINWTAATADGHKMTGAVPFKVN